MVLVINLDDVNLMVYSCYGLTARV